MAEPLLLAGYQGLADKRSTIPTENQSVLDEAAERIVRLYQRWGRPEKAAEWQTNRLAAASQAPQSDHKASRSG